MRRPFPRLLPILAGIVLSGAVQAAPVSRPADVRLSLRIDGWRSEHFLQFDWTVSQASTSVMVDHGLGSISLAAGALQQTTPLVLPLSATTAVQSLTAKSISNAAGTFSLAGAAGQPGEDPCPAAGAGVACVSQLGFGGTMLLQGSLNYQLIPGFITIPVPFPTLGVGRGGAGTAAPVTADAAPFTVRTAQALTASGAAFARSGTVSASTFRLVSPTYVDLIGIEIAVFTTLEIEFTDGGGVPDFVSQVPEASVVVLLTVAGFALALRLGPPR